MKRKRSWSGLVGLVMLIAGAKLFFSGDSEYLPLWTAWLVGPILWYGGFITICYWFLMRIFGPKAEGSKKATESGARLRVVTVAKPQKQPTSIHYRCEFVRPGVSYQKLALIGATL